MANSRAWLTQAESDLAAASKLREIGLPILNCQVAAKCQQTVEKSIKAVIAELAERRVLVIHIAFDHSIERYVKAIRKAPQTRHGSVPENVKQILERNSADINAIMGLAPHRPDDMNRLPRNTEYPFHDANGSLTAPADHGVFTQADVDGHLKTARVLFRSAAALLDIAGLTPR